MKGLRCSAGGLRCACCCAYKSLPLKRQPACFIHSTENECGFLCLCVPMLENQYMAQWFWQFSSQCYPIPKSNCLSSFSISPSSVLYCPTACLLSKQHFRSQNKPIIFLPDRRTNQPIVLWVFELPLLLSWVCVCVCLVLQHRQQGVFFLAGIWRLARWWQCMVGGLEGSPQLPITLRSLFGCCCCRSAPPLCFEQGCFLLTLGTQEMKEAGDWWCSFIAPASRIYLPWSFFMVSSNLELIVWFSLEGCRKISILWLIPHV